MFFFKFSKNFDQIQMKTFIRLAQLHGIVGIKVEVGTYYKSNFPTSQKREDNCIWFLCEHLYF